MIPFLHAGSLIGVWTVSLVLGAAAVPASRSPEPAAAHARHLPPIVFVARVPAAEPGVVPGLGPHHRSLVTGGRLLLRAPDGAIRPLLPDGAFHDVADPAISNDGRRVAFAGTVHRDSAWRIWTVGIDGGDLMRLTSAERGFDLPDAPRVPRAFQRFDDTDPCWVGERLLCFASTRFPQRSPYAGIAVANLYLIRDDGTALRRITAERNGAESPAFDPRSGRIVYGRWWFNPWLAAAVPGGISSDPLGALPRDSINVWQLVEITPGAHGPRLAAGSAASRRDAMGVEPAIARDGSMFATYALNLGLSPRPGPVGVHRMMARSTRRIAGAIVPERARDAYQGTQGLAAPLACAPAVLPDGRVLMSYAPGGRGDFGLWIASANGRELTPLLDLPGTHELDAAPVVRRARGPSGWDADRGIDAAAERALMRGTISDPALGTFTFACDDVFANGGLAGAPARVAGARLRFFAALPRIDRASGDTVIAVREAAVSAGGAVRIAGLPANVPMFEQLVDAKGAVMITAHGPAHVPGMNAGSPGTVTRCLGCHTGHSRIVVPGMARR